MSRSVSPPSSVTNTSPCWNGFIVPGSTLMYGSSFWLTTRRPRARNSRPREAAVMPFPRLLTTPPVTKTYLVMSLGIRTVAAGCRSRGFPRSGESEQLRRVSLALDAVLDAAQHAGQLGQPLVTLDPSDLGGVVGAFHDEVGVGESGDLREVGDHEDLPID